MPQPDEASLLDGAVRTAEAVCAQLSALAPDSRAFAALLEVAEGHRDAVMLLRTRAALGPGEAGHRLAEADAVLADLRDVAAAVAAQYREMAGVRRRRPRARRAHGRPRRRR